MYNRNFALASLLALSSKAEEAGQRAPNLGLRGSDGAQNEAIVSEVVFHPSSEVGAMSGWHWCGNMSTIGTITRGRKYSLFVDSFSADGTDGKVWGCPPSTIEWMGCCNFCGNFLEENGMLKGGWGCEVAPFHGVWLRGCNTHGQTCAGDAVAQDVVKAGQGLD